MPSWQYEKKELRTSPSAKDGIDYEAECNSRKEGARFIIDVGSDLNLKYDTVGTGCVYFHRFFMFHSFKDFDRHIAALGCLFLAGKVEETPKKCRDLIRFARQRLGDDHFNGVGEELREEIMTIERILLQTIKFDLQVDHPYQYLLKYAKILKGDQEKIQKMVQMAWTFINDSLCTSLCLQWEPEIIAIALMYLASRLSKFNIEDWHGRPPGPPTAEQKWWDQFVEDMSMELLEDICHQVLDLYSPGAKDKNAPIQKAPTIAGSASSTPSPNAFSRTMPPMKVSASSLPSTPTTVVNKQPLLSHAGKPALQPPPPPPPLPLHMQQMPPAEPPVRPPIGPPHPMVIHGQPPPSYAYPVPPPGIAGPGPSFAVPPGNVYAPYAPFPMQGPPPTGAPPPAYAVPTGYVGAPNNCYAAPTAVPHTFNVPPPFMGPHPGYGGQPPPPPLHHAHRPPFPAQRRGV